MIDLHWIELYVFSLPHATKRVKIEWDCDLYELDGKIFARLGTYKDDRPLLVVKVDPYHGDLLKQQFEGVIIPGYYANKDNWISIFLDVALDRVIIKDCLLEGYQLILKKLSKKRKQALSLNENLS